MIQNSGLEDGRVTSLKIYAKKQIAENFNSFLRDIARILSRPFMSRVNGKRPSTKQWQDNNQKLDDEQ